jgi:GTP 3',8-cyclase
VGDIRGDTIPSITFVTLRRVGSAVTCDRLRLAADGSVHNCLFSDDGFSVRDVIRSGGTDESIAAVFRRTVGAKRAGLGTDDVSLVRPAHSMSMIGG